MSELVKYKVGMLLAGIYLLLVLSCLMFLYLIDDRNLLVALILMILTAPWSIFLPWVPVKLGIITGEIASHKHDALFFIVETAIGALINASILYFLGFLLTKAFNSPSSKNKAVANYPVRKR